MHFKQHIYNVSLYINWIKRHVTEILTTEEPL